MANKNNNERMGIIARTKKYFHGVKSELKKVTWPNKKDLKNYTLIVLGVSLVVAVITGIFDVLFSQVFLNWL